MHYTTVLVRYGTDKELTPDDIDDIHIFVRGQLTNNFQQYLIPDAFKDVTVTLELLKPDGEPAIIFDKIGRPYKPEDKTVVRKIHVNGVEHTVQGNYSSYEKIAELAGYSPDRFPSITFFTAKKEPRIARTEGILSRGEEILLGDSMHFDAIETNRA